MKLIDIIPYHDVLGQPLSLGFPDDFPDPASCWYTGAGVGDEPAWNWPRVSIIYLTKFQVMRILPDKFVLQLKSSLAKILFELLGVDRTSYLCRKLDSTR